MTDIFVFSPCIEVDWSQEFDRFHDHDKNGNDMALKLKRSAFTTQFSYPSQVPLKVLLNLILRRTFWEVANHDLGNIFAFLVPIIILHNIAW